MALAVLGRKWYEGTLVLILALVVARLILELPERTTPGPAICQARRRCSSPPFTSGRWLHCEA